MFGQGADELLFRKRTFDWNGFDRNQFESGGFDQFLHREHAVIIDMSVDVDVAVCAVGLQLLEEIGAMVPEALR